MKKNKSESQMKWPTKFFFILFFIFIFRNTAPAEESKKVLILPFTIHSEKDLSFMQSGIFNMLSTRLSQAGKFIPISKERTLQAVHGLSGPISEKTALSLGKNLEADFVLLGSLTVFGDSISTDSRFMDVHSGKPVVVFNQQGKSHGDVINHVYIFATQINEKMFGRKTHADHLTPQPESRTDTRRHPEAVWAESRGMISSECDTAGHGKLPFTFWKSRKL